MQCLSFESPEHFGKLTTCTSTVNNSDTFNGGTMQSNGASAVYGAYALATVDTFRCVACRVDAGVDKIIWPNQSVQIGDSIMIGYSYLWSPDTNLSDKEIANPIANPASSLIYMVNSTNANGCEAADEVFIDVIPRPGMPPCLNGDQ